MEIQQVLKEETGLKKAAHFFVQKIAAPETSDNERFAYWNFLFQAGFYREILMSMSQRLNEKQRIHWGLFVETLAKIEAKPTSSTLSGIFKGLKRQNANEDLWACFSWDNLDPRFAEIRSALLESKLKTGRERRGVLLEKFHFLQSQRLRDQAATTIKRLIFLYPGDRELIQIKAAFDEEWAREVLSDRVFDIRNDDAPSPSLNAQDTALIQCWIECATKAVAKTPAAAADFAVLFLFDNVEEAALLVARKTPKNFVLDWLIAELLFLLRRYVDLLEHLASMENEYLSDPETAFGVAYLRAQALKEMGQSAAAVEILRNVVQVRPNYRSANHLINEWSVGAAVG